MCPRRRTCRSPACATWHRGAHGHSRRIAGAPPASLEADVPSHSHVSARRPGNVAMYALEHSKPGSGFHDWGGALFWVSAQLTTVSSQMPNPVTGWGKALDIVLEVWAITVAATLAASLAAFFRARHVEHMAGS